MMGHLCSLRDFLLISARRPSVIAPAYISAFAPAPRYSDVAKIAGLRHHVGLEFIHSLLATRGLRVPDRTAASAHHAISFGPFRLVPSQQLLLEDGKPVRLGSRALDILIALAERPNELVSKEDLIARVWPDTFVEEGNLRVHIATLRRALGDGQAGKRYVANIPGRGYRFVAPISLSTEQASQAPPPSAAARTYELPAPPTRMLGRDDIVNSLISQLPQRRFITLVGPGGIGKTTVALAVADRSTASYPDGVRFVDLAPLTDPLLVPSALAFVLGLAIRSDSPIPGLVALLRDKKMLLVLDSCEHVIDAAASLAEQVLRGAPGVHILTTSREALRAQGERVQRLGPLAFQPSPPALRQRRQSPIQLFSSLSNARPRVWIRSN